MNIFLIRHSLLFVLLVIAAPSVMAQEASDDYTKNVAPILKKYCAGCHNDRESEGSFSVQSYESLQNGSDSGDAYEANDSESSLMIMLMTGEEEPLMPPDGEKRPSEKEIAKIAQWIDAGGAAPKKVAEPAPKKMEPEVIPDKTIPQATPAAITSADWSKDAIAISHYRTVALLDPKTEELIKSFHDFPGKVNAIRFSADGKRLTVASGKTGESGHVSIWDVESGKQTQMIEGHNDTIYMACESPDGKLLATASYDRSIIVWELATKKRLQTLTGHNDAIYDLDFSSDSKTLVSASGDQTIKIWNVATGLRLDTLGQPLEEQFATRISPDNSLIVGGGRDNRIRVWKFVSRAKPEVNPLLHARFAHEGSIVQLKFSRDGSRLFSSSEDRTIKVWDTKDFRQVGTISDQSDVGAALAISPDGSQIFVGRLDGSTSIIDVPKALPRNEAARIASGSAAVGLAESEVSTIDESEPNNDAGAAETLTIPAIVNGKIESETDSDYFAFNATKGQPLVLEIKASRNKSPLDSKIEILDSDGQPVPRVVLRSVRDSYFTFRGKDSNNSNDFRVHNYEEMELNEYLYSGGEVVKLFLHPRGPDSGFKVYPGYGKRYGYFGTTSVSHPLHEPAYVVRPYPVGTEFPPNGLPVFNLNYENDDESFRKFGKDSMLYFTPPADGDFLVRVSDVRGFGGDEFVYQLHVRNPQPDFSVKHGAVKELFKGSGQEIVFTADRRDRFDGEIEINVNNVPDSISITSPLRIESGHNQAMGTIHLKDNSEPPTQEELSAIQFTATAMLGDAKLERKIKGLGEVKINDKPKIKIRIVRPKTETDKLFESEPGDPLTVELKPGEKVELKVVAQRINHKGRISFGNETSGRNLPHGVYVDDIGLNGLMITAGNTEQRFFITAEDWVKPSEHTFHIRANDVQGQTSWPIVVRVLER